MKIMPTINDCYPQITRMEIWFGAIDVIGKPTGPVRNLITSIVIYAKFMRKYLPIPTLLTYPYQGNAIMFSIYHY
jgi:hypothetical protein